MLCHTVPPIPSHRLPLPEPVDDLNFPYDIDAPEPEPTTPEPHEWGPAPHILQ